MINSSGMRKSRLLFGAALMVAAGVSHAQYVWVNEKGVRQISDKAPPANVPLKNILRAPGGVPADTPPPAASATAATATAGLAATASGAAPAPAAAAPDAGKSKLTPDQTRLAEREADYKKRKAETLEKEAKEKAERLAKENRKASCDSAKQYKATLDTNQPVTTVNSAGEAVYMEDAQRKKLGDQAQKVLNDCNKR